MEKELVKPLREVLDAARLGFYETEGKTICLPFTDDEIRQVKVYTPETLGKLCPEAIPAVEPVRIVLRNQDTLQAAFDLNQIRQQGEMPVLVLNFANPRRPGGGIREIPGTQEEHLCVKTTVYASLASEEAKTFYDTNKTCGTQAQTDAVMISPNTLVLRSPDLSFREDPFPVSVLTVSAPIASRMKEAERTDLEKILRRRIRGMLRAAVDGGYRYLVLGAWGCGNFRNDPVLVARLFREVLEEPLGEVRTKDYFLRITMAVFDRSEEKKLYRAFEGFFEEG